MMISRSLQQSIFRAAPSIRFFHALGHPPTLEENPVRMQFGWTKQKDRVDVLAREGESLLDVAHNNGIDLEGACESSLACSTCHVILSDEIYDSLGEPVEEEEDLLDLAYGLTHTSRLGCQVKVTRDMEGMLVTLPSATRNFYVDKSKL
jgi:ferredoxin-2, mitochondrial